jgi:hypothetical protein
MYQGIFIDNQDSDKQFAGLMSTPGPHGLQVSFKKSRELMTLAQEILENKPDLVALDYRLDGYPAGALAQLLRDSAMNSVAEDFPIILVSPPSELKSFFDNVTTHDLFDWYFSKETLSSTHRIEVLSLVLGYKKLIKYWNQPQRWASLLDVTQTEKLEVAYQAIRELDKLKAPHQVAHDILRYIINRQGLLLDKYNLLAQLGVEKNGKDVNVILEILKTDQVLYTGIFSDGWTRWWLHRLQDWGENLCGESLGNMTAKQRISCLNNKLGLELSAAKSRWQNNTDAFFGFACASCHQPTEREFSVLAYDPTPYSFVQRKSICWKCVETGEFKKHNLEIDDGEELIVEKLINGEIRR